MPNAEFGLNGLYVDGIIKERNISDLTRAIFGVVPNLKQAWLAGSQVTSEVDNQIKKMAGIDSTINSRHPSFISYFGGKFETG